MTPAIYDFQIKKRGIYKLHLTHNSDGIPTDLTGYTAKMQIRKDYGGTVIAELDETDGIVLGGDEGTILITLLDTLTATFNFDVARYDLYIDSGTEKTYILEGSIQLKKTITE
jgi:hypothetical protein